MSDGTALVPTTGSRYAAKAFELFAEASDDLDEHLKEREARLLRKVAEATGARIVTNVGRNEPCPCARASNTNDVTGSGDGGPLGVVIGRPQDAGFIGKDDGGHAVSQA
jgi:hypothetical protein